MQALSIWPSKGDFLEAPHLESLLDSTNFGCGFRRGSSRSRTRRKDLEGVDSVVTLCRIPGLLFNSSRLLVRIGDGASYCTPFVGKTKTFVYGEWRSCGDSRSFPVVRAIEDQAVGDNVGNVNSDQIDKLSSVALDKVENVDTKDFEEETRENVGYKDEKNGNTEDFEEEKKGRVVVRKLAQALHLAESVDDVEAALKGKEDLPLQVFSCIISGFGREKRLDPAIAIVDWLKKRHKENDAFDGPNLFIYNSLLGAVKQSQQLDKVDVVMNEMEENGIVPNVVTYNTLMGIYLEQGRPTEALHVFKDVIPSNGLSPSPASYSTALLAYRRMEDGFGALEFFLSFKEKYVKGELQQTTNGGEDWHNEFSKFKDFTSRICYQVMRRWLSKEGNFSTDVLKLLIEMDKADLPPSREEYERLAWACTREEHSSVAKELYIRIREKYSDISLSVCNHIIWLLGKAKKWWAALEVYEDLLDKGPKPNNLSYELIVSHFNVLLGAARKRGIWTWGMKLLEKMESKGLKPGAREWNSVLIACAKASETAAAIDIFKKMVERGEKPTIVSYGALLSALEKGKLYEEANRVWEHMLKVGVEPNIYAYTIMASVYVGHGKFHLVDYILQEMASKGTDPTVVTFNAIISRCARAGLGGPAYEWFQRMRSMNIEPNDITYETLIEALAKDGKPKLAYDMYLRAVNEGMGPSSEAYDAVVKSAESLGATVDLTALGPRPPEKRKRVVVNRRGPPESSGMGEDSWRNNESSDSKEVFV